MKLFRCLIAGLTSFAASGLAQASSKTIDAVYQITWRGFQVGQISTETSVSETRYEMNFGAKTVGIVGTIFPFESNGMAAGQMTDVGPLSEDFTGTRKRENEIRSWRVVFDQHGSVVEREVDAADLMDREPVPRELWQGPDPVTLGLIAILQASPGAELSGRSFDGRRVIDSSMACDPHAGLSAQNGGEELRCELRGELIAGASQRWRERSDNPAPDRHVAVWLTKGIFEDGWWPVRMEATTRFGLVAATLVDEPS